jgi:hypothetical protein
MSPEFPCDLERIDTNLLPPTWLIAGPMDRSVMRPTKRDCEFIAHFASERPGLSKAQVMGIRRLAAADQAGLRGDEPQVLLVAVAPGFGNGEDALVDAVGLINSRNIRFRRWRRGGRVDCSSGGDNM